MIAWVAQKAGIQMMLAVYDSSIEQALIDIGRREIYERDTLQELWDTFLQHAAPSVALTRKLRFVQIDLKNRLTASEWKRFSERYEVHLKANLRQLLKWYLFAIRLALKLFGIGVDDLIEIGLSLILDN